MAYAVSSPYLERVEGGSSRLQRAITANNHPGHLYSTSDGEPGILAMVCSISSKRLFALPTSFSRADRSFILLKNK
jgi:hypothetical protein